MTMMKSPIGEIGFNSLDVARGFGKVGNEEGPKNFNMVLILDRKEADTFIAELQAALDRGHASEIEKRKARGEPARLAVGLLNYKELTDGKVSFNFKRKEILGMPIVVDSSKKPTSAKIQKGSRVRVSFGTRPYVINNTVGLSLVLEAVQVMETGLSLTSATSLFDAVEDTKKETKIDKVQDLF